MQFRSPEVNTVAAAVRVTEGLELAKESYDA